MKPAREGDSATTSPEKQLKIQGASSKSSDSVSPQAPQNAQVAPKITASAEPSSQPILKIIKVEIPKKTLAFLEREHIDQELARLLVNDLYVDRHVPAHRHAIGRNDSAFYIQNLPEVLKPFAQGTHNLTISSAVLMRQPFLADFQKNTAWAEARTIYCNLMFSESVKQSSLEKTEPSPEESEAELKCYQASAEVIARILLGQPPSLENSPLPARLLDFLVRCDQLFHQKLLSGERSQKYTTAEVRDARFAMLKQLLVTRTLQPMLVQLAGKHPPEHAIKFLALVMQSLLASCKELSTKILVKSFATWPESLQKAATEKARRETVETRKKMLKSKPSVRHHRSRSADTTLVDISALPKNREEAKARRQRQQALAMASQVEAETELFGQALIAARKMVDEKVAYEQGLESIKDLSADDLNDLLKMIKEQDSDEFLMALLPDEVPKAQRATPLDNPALVTTTSTASTASTTSITSAESIESTSDNTATSGEASVSQAPTNQ